METEELKITIPEGQEIDWQESAKQEKIVFKKKDTKPRSWEEYCKNHYGDYYYISSDSNIIGLGYNPGHCELSPIYAKNVMPTKELAEAFIAMMQLMSLRQAWIGDWKPDWKNVKQQKVCILCNNDEFIDGHSIDLVSRPLSFPTKEMTRNFINCFKDLLEIAKPLI